MTSGHEGNWTVEEDRLLRQCAQDYREAWPTIQERHFPLRSTDDLQLRYGLLEASHQGTDLSSSSLLNMDFDSFLDPQHMASSGFMSHSNNLINLNFNGNDQTTQDDHSLQASPRQSTSSSFSSSFDSTQRLGQQPGGSLPIDAATFVLTIENPQKELVQDVMGYLVSSRATFRSEMQ